jgi:hypothetical protein
MEFSTCGIMLAFKKFQILEYFGFGMLKLFRYSSQKQNLVAMETHY